MDDDEMAFNPVIELDEESYQFYHSKIQDNVTISLTYMIY